jgi:hypothetical protein
VEQQELERVARKALKELGVPDAGLTVRAGTQPGMWRIELGDHRALNIKCGQGSSPQWVRDQIFEQVLR